MTRSPALLSMSIALTVLLTTGCPSGNPVTSITVTPNNPTVKVGKNVRLQGVAYDANNKLLPNAELHWFSSDNAIATVTDSGTVTGMSTGTVTITAYSGSIQGSATVTVQPDLHYTLTVGFTGAGTGQVTSSPAGISCTAAPCSADFSEGTQLSLVAVGTNNSAFIGWSGACSGTEPCILTIGSNLSVTANFAPPYMLTVNVNGSGVVGSFPLGITCPTNSCTAGYQAGTQITLTATPSTGGSFISWGGACAGFNNQCTVTMSSNLTVDANFVLLPVLSVTVTGQGKVSSSPPGISCSSGTCTSTFANNASVTLSPLAMPNYSFTGWSGACTGFSNCVVQMNADQSVTANFVLTSTLPTLSVTIVGPGAGAISSSPGGISCGSGTCTAHYPNGLPVTLTEAPLGSSQFTGWSGACTGTSNTCSVVMNGNLAVNATFSVGLKAPAGNGTTGIAIESGDATALITGPDRLDRLELVDSTVVKTIASGLSAPAGVAIEPGGATALVTEGNNLTRIDLETGALTRVTSQLFNPTGLAIEDSGSSALVADCGSESCSTTGRLVRVELATGAVTVLMRTHLGIDTPRGIAIEPGGATALVGEGGSGKLLRVRLSDGNVSVLASPAHHGLTDGIEGIAIERDGTTALVTSRTELVRVDLRTGAQTRISSSLAESQHLGGLAITSSGDAVVMGSARASVVRVATVAP